MGRDIKFLFKTYKPYWHLILVAVFGSILESGALAGLAYIIKNVVDDVFVAKSYEKLVFIISVLIGLAVAKQVGFFLKDFVYPLVIYKALRVLREKVYKRILHARPSFFRKVQPGDLISRATTDTERFGEISATIGTNVITETFTVIGIVAVLIYRDWKMFLIFLFAVPFLALALNYFGEKRKKYSKKLQESFSHYIQHLNQILSGIEVVKLFKDRIFLELFHRINENLYIRQKKNRLYETVYLSSVEVIAYIATAGIIFYGGSRIIKGEITPGDFFSFLGGILILVNSLQVLQRGAVNLKALSPVIDRILFVLNIPQEEEKGQEFKGLKNSIQYRNVSLKIGEMQILKNVNLSIKKGEKIGIVGLTGSGKSTLVKILPALITDYEGKVLLDSIELREYSVSSLREKIGMVSQDVFIFNDTLKNNLLIAKPDATDEEILEALKKAKADFVFELENGLDTVLGEKGSRLSGGERQRISIARIFLKNPDIVIIDEATSALDVETEEYVMEEISRHFREKTVLMITHRLKLLEISDRVVVMENGQIVEEGTKEELLQKKGIFYRFLTLSST
ncbi:ATP-binding cassette, subfamily B, MsbA [Persephonella hydrogeniphila]|uniref:ATP-binding cassette, subfamily B, MsbA n=1 Tax=Persephonella hydrogeniphila TaxID=198703 RepID=A0A285NJ78_9AQUI|nr:ABC transporter ATP-binding protein [Persephonella hydrogeniphila]SNZ07916.1 ATP-binding cassette, subfamily B, MsbA [Persephonella hydrogeniphila]